MQKFSTETPVIWSEAGQFMAVRQFGAKSSAIEGGATKPEEASNNPDSAADGVKGGQKLGRGPFVPAEVTDLHDCLGDACGPKITLSEATETTEARVSQSHRQTCKVLWAKHGAEQTLRLKLPDGALTPPLSAALFQLAEESAAQTDG